MTRLLSGLSRRSVRCFFKKLRINLGVDLNLLQLARATLFASASHHLLERDRNTIHDFPVSVIGGLFGRAIPPHGAGGGTQDPTAARIDKPADVSAVGI